MAAPGDEEVVATAPDGATLRSRTTELLGGPLRFAGTLPRVAPGQAVVLQRLDRKRGWTPIAQAVAGPGGAFGATWKATSIGRLQVRAVPAQAPAEVQASAAGPTRRVTVFKPGVATFFGPGLYGRRTACGQKLTRKLLGVAHRTLKCGTQVDLLFEGRTITVPVVDRGPFRKGTTWDLTSAAAQALGMDATSTIGAVRVPQALAPATPGPAA